MGKFVLIAAIIASPFGGLPFQIALLLLALLLVLDSERRAVRAEIRIEELEGSLRSAAQQQTERQESVRIVQDCQLGDTPCSKGQSPASNTVPFRLPYRPLRQD